MTLNQHFFKHAVFLPVTALRGERVQHYLNRLERSQWLSPEEILLIQNEKFRRLLDHVGEFVPYYRKTLPDLGDATGTSLATLAKLPFLDKSGLRANQHDLLAVDRPKRLTKKTTGGSTGQAVTVYKSREATAQETAGQFRGFCWAGIDIGDRQARFWGLPDSPRDRLKAKLSDIICNRRRCSAFAFSERDMAEYTALLARFKPVYLYGYVSMLCRYTEYLEATSKMPARGLRAIVTTSEELTSSHRALLERVFDAPVFNEYGCGEIGTIAHECRNGSMHINAENMIVEILDGDRPCEENEIGEIVVTELNNHAMPLIRYRLGDFAAFSGEPCDCGRNLPVIARIAGRAYDLVYNKEGEMFHGEFFMYIFEEVKRRGLGVSAFRVVEDTLEHFTIYVQPDDGYGRATENLIRDRIQTGYGGYAEVDFVQSEEIKREASGKLRLIVGLGPTVGET